MSKQQKLFIAELTEMLGEKYVVKKTKNKYEDYGAKIIVIAEFNCCVHHEKYGWTECHKCDCHYGCNVSQRFDDLIKKHGYKFEWIYPGRGGLFYHNK